MELRKILLVLSVLSCFFLSSSALAAQWGDFTYEVSGDTVTVTQYTGAGGAVAIPGSIDSKPVVSIGYSAFVDCTGLTSIIIPGSVVSIGGQVFSGCTGLTSVTIMNGVTDIGYWAFSDCTGLTGITLPASVTSIGESPFLYCSALTAISVDPNNTVYSSHDGVLYTKDKTTLVAYPCGKPGVFSIPNDVISIGNNAFYGCTGLTGVIMPASVVYIGYYAFVDCTNLASVVFSSCISYIENTTFLGCTSLLAAYFYGNAPSLGDYYFNAFDQGASGFTVYYFTGSTGFTNPWYGYPAAVFTDSDSDVVPDAIDNCPNTCNHSQIDADSDGIGDLCDPSSGCGGCGQTACEQPGLCDTDYDGVSDSVDNCPTAFNPFQNDIDSDGIGDVCDPTPGCGGCGQTMCEEVCVKQTI